MNIWKFHTAPVKLTSPSLRLEIVPGSSAAIAASAWNARWLQGFCALLFWGTWHPQFFQLSGSWCSWTVFPLIFHERKHLYMFMRDLHWGKYAESDTGTHVRLCSCLYWAKSWDVKIIIRQCKGEIELFPQALSCSVSFCPTNTTFVLQQTAIE